MGEWQPIDKFLRTVDANRHTRNGYTPPTPTALDRLVAHCERRLEQALHYLGERPESLFGQAQLDRYQRDLSVAYAARDKEQHGDYDTMSVLMETPPSSIATRRTTWEPWQDPRT